MELAYYYQHEADQFSFIRIPRAMMTEELFASLSLQSKILYGLLLDRVSVARKNQWVDEVLFSTLNVASFFALNGAILA